VASRMGSLLGAIGLAVAWGILATAIVQVPYLGHGDAGLVANLSMALLFSGLGGVVSGSGGRSAGSFGRTGTFSRRDDVSPA
jgi:hypothetical protein